MRSRRASEGLTARARAAKAASRHAEAESAAEMAQAAAAAEAADAVAGLAIGLSSAALDAALTAVAAAAEASVGSPTEEAGAGGEDGSAAGESADARGQSWQKSFASWATNQRDTLRDTTETEERLRRLHLFEAELALLGISMDDAGSLDEKALRQAFRRRSRVLHPDAQPGAGEPGATVFDGEEPTIYDLNEAYTAVRKVLW
jgi:hypothetical protein